ncbi:MAG: hypothetical protein ACLFUS_08905 [Candidatus Sumerlaeia bacterium]
MADSKSPEEKPKSPRKHGKGAPKKYRRSQWIVDMVFQGQFILQLVLISLLAGVIAGMITLFFIVKVEDGNPQVDRVVLEALPRVALESVIVTVLVLPIIALFLSHRIAGPIYRIRDSIQRVKRGDLSFRIGLRRFDHFKNLAQEFNTLLDQLEGERRSRMKESQEAADQIRRALKMIESPDQSQLPEALRILEETSARLRD